VAGGVPPVSCCAGLGGEKKSESERVLERARAGKQNEKKEKGKRMDAYYYYYAAGDCDDDDEQTAAAEEGATATAAVPPQPQPLSLSGSSSSSSYCYCGNGGDDGGEDGASSRSFSFFGCLDSYRASAVPPFAVVVVLLVLLLMTTTLLLLLLRARRRRRSNKNSTTTTTATEKPYAPYYSRTRRRRRTTTTSKSSSSDPLWTRMMSLSSSSSSTSNNSKMKKRRTSGAGGVHGKMSRTTTSSSGTRTRTTTITSDALWKRMTSSLSSSSSSRTTTRKSTRVSTAAAAAAATTVTTSAAARDDDLRCEGVEEEFREHRGNDDEQPKRYDSEEEEEVEDTEGNSIHKDIVDGVSDPYEEGAVDEDDDVAEVDYPYEDNDNDDEAGQGDSEGTEEENRGSTFLPPLRETSAVATTRRRSSRRRNLQQQGGQQYRTTSAPWYCRSSVGVSSLCSNKRNQQQLALAADWIRSSRRILVVSGAGVSVSAGIPDFRTPGTGLYDNLQGYDLPFPEAVFDLAFFKKQPRYFVELASQLWPRTCGDRPDCAGAQHGGRYAAPTLTHVFLAMLSDRGMLLRNYTQNIDGLELAAQVPERELVECHGHFRKAYCVRCHQEASDIDQVRYTMLSERRVAICEYCDLKCNYVKPALTFFGEDLPERFHDLVDDDMEEADLLLVLGTSLQVAPMSKIPHHVDCRRVLLNRECVGGIGADYFRVDVHEDYEEENGKTSIDDSASSSSLRRRRSTRTAVTQRQSHCSFRRDSYSAPSPSSLSQTSASVSVGEGELIDHAVGASGVDSSAEGRDIFCAGDCDDSMLQIAQYLGWGDELEFRHRRLA